MTIQYIGCMAGELGRRGPFPGGDDVRGQNRVRIHLVMGQFSPSQKLRFCCGGPTIHSHLVIDIGSDEDQQKPEAHSFYQEFC